MTPGSLALIGAEGRPLMTKRAAPALIDSGAMTPPPSWRDDPVSGLGADAPNPKQQISNKAK